jgi:hypothetical protein
MTFIKIGNHRIKLSTIFDYQIYEGIVYIQCSVGDKIWEIKVDWSDSVEEDIKALDAILS